MNLKPTYRILWGVPGLSVLLDHKCSISPLYCMDGMVLVRINAASNCLRCVLLTPKMHFSSAPCGQFVGCT